MMAGTLGYMAPEMPHTGKATKETDVYSFGVLMLEVMCGTRPLDTTAIERGEGVLVNRVWLAHEAGNILQVADSRLDTFPDSGSNSVSYGGFKPLEASRNWTMKDNLQDDDSSTAATPDAAIDEKTMIRNLLQLGLLCCNPNPEDRPSTRLVSQLLQSPEKMKMSMPPLPICRPDAHYNRPGFSQILAMRLSADSTLSSADDVVEGRQERSGSSFAASSEILSGR